MSVVWNYTKSQQSKKATISAATTLYDFQDFKYLISF